MDGHSAPAPLAKRVSSRNLTLQDFKEKVFARKGSYRLDISLTLQDDMVFDAFDAV